MLFKIFRTPQSVSFVNQYEKYTSDYEKNFPGHEEVDYFQEYIRPFLSKKQRVNKFSDYFTFIKIICKLKYFACKSLDLEESQTISKESLTDIKWWHFDAYLAGSEQSAYETWLKSLINTLVESCPFKDEICIIIKPLFQLDVSLYDYKHNKKLTIL